MSIAHQGSCLCGGVRFSIRGQLAPIEICHCPQCRQAQGGPIATSIPVKATTLELLEGEELLQQYESSPGKVRVFCKVCGSPVFSKRDSVPGVLRIRAGLLQEPVGTQLAFHAFTASKASWWPIVPGLPEFTEGAPQPARRRSTTPRS
ncbi:MAG: GFA family protein [Pseudomonadota bacterium]